MKLLYCEDNEKLRQIIKRLMISYKIVTSVDDVSNGELVISKMENAHYDLVVLHIHLQSINGIETLRTIKTRWPAIPVLMLTMRKAEDFALYTLDLGASGYIEKRNAIEFLEEAITLTSQGEKYISEEVAALMAERERDAAHIKY